VETCGSAARNVCSAAGKLMFIRRRKKYAGLWRKRWRLWESLFGCGSIVQPPEKGRGCGKVCSAAGALFSRRKKVAAVERFVQPPEKGRGCGKVCSAAGALFSRRKKVAAVERFVQPREHLFSRRSDRSPGTSLQLYLQKQPKRSNAKRKKKKIK